MTRTELFLTRAAVPLLATAIALTGMAIAVDNVTRGLVV